MGNNVGMSGSAVTPPKGRATRSRAQAGQRRSAISSKLQWTLVVIAAFVALGILYFFVRDVRSNASGQPAAPTDIPAVVTAATST